jgi:hypothetical protein
VASSKKNAKRRRRAQQLAERAERFERHAALVAARSGDPRYPQRVRNDDGSYSVSMTPEVMEMLRQQQQNFRAKFGREPGPEDPLFFDPDLDEPTPLSEDRYNDAFIQAAEGIDDPQIRALARASVDVGYMVTEENQHLFTAHEVEAFGEAVRRNLNDKDELETDLPSFIAGHMQRVVALISDGTADPDLARDLIERFLDDNIDLPEDEIGKILSLQIMLPFKWVIAAKSLGVTESDLNDAVNWIADNLGGLDYAGPAATAAAAIWGGEAGDDLQRHLGKPELTFSDLHDALGQDFGPAMVWLCAGLLATVGAGDVNWLLRLEQSDD